MEEKTNVMRLIEQKKLPCKYHFYEESEALSGKEVAAVLGQDPDAVFKTLVAVGKTGEHYVYVIPASGELDLKKAAKSVGEKSVEMIRMKELLPLTGYIHGGCSPIGMKKLFKTSVDETAQLYDTIYFSAGKIGAQVEMSVDDLGQMIPVQLVDLVKD